MGVYQSQALSSFLYVHVIPLSHDRPMQEVLLVALTNEATEAQRYYFRARRMGRIWAPNPVLLDF